MRRFHRRMAQPATDMPTRPAPRGDGWACPERVPDVPGDGTVHVWRAELDAGEAEQSIQLLSAAECRRAERIVDPLRARRWARSRTVLRMLLGAYLNREPSTLALAAGAHGKPALAGGELEFSLSHSGPLAVYAMSASVPVGIDVELARVKSLPPSLAERTFGAVEAQRLEKLGEQERERELLRLWVRHEAALKLSGTGIGGASEPSAAPWSATLDVPAGAGVALALACGGEVRELRTFGWPLLHPGPRIPF
jgi:4'-phosphopantetheinyl transferase